MKKRSAPSRNDYEPHVCFWRTESAAKFEPKQMLFPAPNLVVEVISPSTAHRDRGVKFDDYAAHGITEYWIIDPEARAVEQYILEGSRYQRIAAGAAIVKSVAMKDLEIPVEAFFADAANLTALRRVPGA